MLNGRNLVLNEDTKVDRYQNVFSATKVISSLVRMLLKDNNETEVQQHVGGKKLEQEVVQYGPFVASSRDNIQKGFPRLSIWKKRI